MVQPRGWPGAPPQFAVRAVHSSLHLLTQPTTEQHAGDNCTASLAPQSSSAEAYRICAASPSARPASRSFSTARSAS